VRSCAPSLAREHPRIPARPGGCQPRRGGRGAARRTADAEHSTGDGIEILVGAPGRRPPGARERLREQREELPARYGARPEAREVRGRQLAVDQAVAPALELAREPDERHLRGVAHTAEHRFAEEGAAERDAVETAGERAVLP